MRAPSEAFMGLIGDTFIPQSSLETWGRLKEWAPCCQFHCGGPKNKPASCQLDKENKMGCTEIHKYGSCQLSCFYSPEFLFPNFSTSVGFKL